MGKNKKNAVKTTVVTVEIAKERIDNINKQMVALKADNKVLEEQIHANNRLWAELLETRRGVYAEKKSVKVAAAATKAAEKAAKATEKVEKAKVNAEKAANRVKKLTEATSPDLFTSTNGKTTAVKKVEIAQEVATEIELDPTALEAELEASKARKPRKAASIKKA
jgi:hypothetical protein